MLARRRLSGVCIFCKFGQLQRSSSRQFASLNRNVGFARPSVATTTRTTRRLQAFTTSTSRLKEQETVTKPIESSATQEQSIDNITSEKVEADSSSQSKEGSFGAAIAEQQVQERAAIDEIAAEEIEEEISFELDVEEIKVPLEGTRAALPDVSMLDIKEGREIIVKYVKARWGEELPEELLEEEEFQLYQALYGTPTRMLTIDEVEKRGKGVALEGEELEEEVLEADEIYAADPDYPRPRTPEPGEEVEEGESEAILAEWTEDYESEIPRNARHMEEEEWVEEEDEFLDDEVEQYMEEAPTTIMGKLESIIARQQALIPPHEPSGEIRTHPLTLSGRFSTDPSTCSLPRSVIQATQDTLSDRNNRHLKQAAERVGPGSVSANLEKKRQNLPSALNPSAPHMSGMESHVYLASVFPQQYAKSLATLVEVRRRLGGEWVRGVKKVLDVGTGGGAAKAWEEVVNAEATAQGGSAKDKEFTKEVKDNMEDKKGKTSKEPSSSTAKHDNKAAKSEEEPWDWGYGIEGLPNSRSFNTTVIAGSDSLQRNISPFLENTLFLPRLPHYVQSYGLDTDIEWEDAQNRQSAKRSFDLIIASDTILREGPSHRQRFHVDNLWSLLNPDGGVLIMIEHGSREGFSAIAGARAHILKRKIRHPQGEGIQHELTIHEQEKAEMLDASKSEGMIIAPCTNHTDCPMWNTVRSELELKGKMNYCHFTQRFLKPNYLMLLSNRKAQNHQDVDFSYLAVRKGSNQYRPTPENPVPTGIDPNSLWEEFVNFDATPTRNSKRTKDGLKERLNDSSSSTTITEEGATETTTPINNNATKPYSASELRTYMLSMPRAILPPIKAKGHVHIDVCTSEGKLERWTVPRSYSDDAYHDARKASWGDLWALGAKTKVARTHGHKKMQEESESKSEKIPRHLRDKARDEEYQERSKKHILDMKRGDEFPEPSKIRNKERKAQDLSKRKIQRIMQENRDSKAKRRGGKWKEEDPEKAERKMIAYKRRKWDSEQKDDQHDSMGLKKTSDA